jgi:hypothetical protein
MCQLVINYSQNGNHYMIEFSQGGNVVKRLIVPPSPNGNLNFEDSIPDGVYDVNSFNLGKNSCILVTGFSWFNPNKGFKSEGRARARGIFNGRKLMQRGIPFENNMYMTYGGSGYGGKNPYNTVVKDWKGSKGFFKIAANGVVARRPTMTVPNDVPVSIDA